MFFTVIGINHHTAPIHIREKVRFSETTIVETSSELAKEPFTEVVILSTWARSEIYMLSKDPISEEKGKEIFTQIVYNADIAEYVFVDSGITAIEHLLFVTSGLDSRLLGDEEITKNVEEALRTAQNIGSAKNVMEEVFETILNFSRELKESEHIGERNMANETIKFLSDKVDFKDKKILVIGIGEYAKKIIRELTAKNYDVSVVNRTYTNSILMKEEFPTISALETEKIEDVVNDYDLIFSGTSSPHTFLMEQDFDNMPRVIMDLSLPRDVDPKVGEKENISLYNLDDIAAEYVVDEETLHSLSQKIQPQAFLIASMIRDARMETIDQSLEERTGEIVKETLNYIARKTDLSHNERKKIAAILESAFEEVANQPLVLVREGNFPPEEKSVALKVLREVYER